MRKLALILMMAFGTMFLMSTPQHEAEAYTAPPGSSCYVQIGNCYYGPWVEFKDENCNSLGTSCTFYDELYNDGWDTCCC